MRLHVPSLALAATFGCALGSSAFAAPFLAIGEGAEVFLTAGLGARYQSNVFLSHNDVDDTIFTVTPGLEVIFGKGSLSSGQFYLQEEFTFYSDLSSLNDELFSTGLVYRYDDQKLRFSFDGSFKQVNEATRDVLFQVFEIIGLIRRDVTRAYTLAELRMTAKFKGSVGIRYDDTEFKPDPYIDRRYLNFPVNLFYEYTEKVDLSVGVSYQDVALSGDGIESTDIYYNVGARGEFTPKLKGDFSLGFRTRDFDRPRAAGGDSKDDMFGFDAGFTYEVTPKITSDFTLSQDFGTGPSGESTDDFSVSLGADASLTPEWSVGAELSYRDTIYNATRQDDFYVVQLTGSYAYNEYLRFTGYYVFSDNNSTYRTQDRSLSFTNHTLGFVANLRY